MGAVIGSVPPLEVMIAVSIAAVVILFALRATERTLSVLALAFVVGLSAQLQLGARLQSDGFYYYAYLRSLAFDHDVDFKNDYRLLGLGDKTYLFQPTPTGLRGVGLDDRSGDRVVAVLRGRPRGRDAAARHRRRCRANGISIPSARRSASPASSTASSAAGSPTGWRGASTRRTRRGRRMLTVGGSFMIWYIVREPSMTHAPSMAAVAGFVWAWIATRGPADVGAWARPRAAAGFMGLIRWQNILFALLPGVDALRR